VAQDGSGQYKTIAEAIEKIPKKKNETFVIYIKEGVYKEQVSLARSHTHVLMIGDGPTKTKITGNLNYANGVQTFKTATVCKYCYPCLESRHRKDNKAH
jgi:pectinesterase